MPTVLRWQGYRFFFYSADGREPPHVHVAKDGKEAKIWLGDLVLALNMGYSAKELNAILTKVRDERESFLEDWRDHFAD
jgi:hypothetical protein